MGKKGFDLAALARSAMAAAGEDVSGSDTDPAPALRLIPFQRILPDPDNGYSLEGIEELAGNIETVGLLDPLVVLPENGAGEFPLLSGHRRLAAIRMIMEDGSAQFEAGVPCIVRTRPAGGGRVTELLDRLTLLMANSDNRKKTSADQNLEAERMEAVVAELAELGFQFPGRRRDWVAELSGMSRSKLARLKVIREKLDPPLRDKYYSTGKLSEDAAYELARLPAETQRQVADFFVTQNKKPEYWYANSITSYATDLKRIGAYTCPKKLGGGPCENREQLMEKVWAKGYHSYTWCAYGDRCCADCSDLPTCRSACGKLAEKAAEMKAERREQKRAMREAEEKEAAPRREQVRSLWRRFGEALDRAGMEDKDLRNRVSGTAMYQVPEADSLALEAGEAKNVKADMVLPYSNSTYLSEITRLTGIADALGCSLDYLFCRTDEPAPVSDPDAGRLRWKPVEDPEKLPEGWLVFWGDGGLKVPPSWTTARSYAAMWPEDYRYWAEITPPEAWNET